MASIDAFRFRSQTRRLLRVPRDLLAEAHFPQPAYERPAKGRAVRLRLISPDPVPPRIPGPEPLANTREKTREAA